MHLEFNRMVQFSLLVKAGDRVREFNFRKLRNPGEEQFTVNVCDERGDRILFSMLKQEGSWRLSSESLPGWIIQNERKLCEEVEKELDRWNNPATRPNSDFY
jgi:hypothetical protein